MAERHAVACNPDLGKWQAVLSLRRVTVTSSTDLTGYEFPVKKADPSPRPRFKGKRQGITAEEYEQRLARQGGQCAICYATESNNGKMFAVDHDHETGVVRGLLCTQCNLLLGHIDANRLTPRWMDAAMAYISRGAAALEDYDC